MNLGSCSRCWERHHVCTCSEEDIKQHKSSREATTLTHRHPAGATFNLPASYKDLVNTYGVPAEVIAGLDMSVQETLIVKHQEEPPVTKQFITATPLKKPESEIIVVPVITSNSKGQLAEGYDLARQVRSGKHTFDTAPLKADVTCNLMGISNLAYHVREDNFDVGAVIDKDINIETIYISVGGSKLMFDVSSLPFAKGIPSCDPTSVGRRSNFAFESEQLVIDTQTRDVLNERFNYSHLIDTNNFRVILSVRLNGFVDREKGDMRFDGGSVHIKTIDTGMQLGTEALTIAQDLLEAAFGEMKIVGFDLNAKYVSA